MLHREHSAILSTFIKLPFVFKIFVMSIFEWPLKTGFTVSCPSNEDLFEPRLFISDTDLAVLSVMTSHLA